MGLEGRTTRAWQRLFLSVGTLALGAAALELTFGSWLRANPWERAFALNIVVNAKLTYDATELYGGGPVVYTRDGYGLRGNYGHPEDITILTLGGSTTDQRYLSDGQTWQDELERRLRAAGKRARVANAGVDGHSTFGHLAAYRYWFPLIPRLKPAYTILYVGINDFFMTEPAVPWEGTTDGAVTLKSRIKADSAFYRLFARTRGTLLAYRLGLWHTRVDFEDFRDVDAPRMRDHEVVGRVYGASFRPRFMRLLDRVRAGGSLPVCVTQPTWYYRVDENGRVSGLNADVSFEEPIPIHEMNGLDYFLLRRALDAIILAACTSAGAPTIDLAIAAWEAEDFYDFVHMTPAGARKLGARIADVMQNLPW